MYRLLVVTAAIVLAGAAPAAADIRINEVDSQPTDWVELTNTGAAPVVIDNYVLKDSGNGQNVTIDNKTLQPGEFFGRTSPASATPTRCGCSCRWRDADRQLRLSGPRAGHVGALPGRHRRASA